MKNLNYQNFINFELNFMIFNFFVKMSTNDKYTKNL